MSLIPKLYEGTKYVSHTIEEVRLRRSPIMRWQVEVQMENPTGETPPRFSAQVDIDKSLNKAGGKNAITKTVMGIKKQWEKRTSESSDFTEILLEELLELYDESYDND